MPPSPAPTSDLLATIQTTGWACVPSELSSTSLSDLRESLFQSSAVGTRCLLDQPLVREAARQVKAHLIATDILGSQAVAIQAIAFDKNPAINWKVSWHQDVMFPFARVPRSPGFTLVSRKDGIDFARPPRAILEQLLAVRLHLDDCDADNGPLRVSPGSHQLGLIRSTEIAAAVSAHGEIPCLAHQGEALLMKPLLLHASSPAKAPTHRRVLHLVYHNGPSPAEPWHRCV